MRRGTHVDLDLVSSDPSGWYWFDGRNIGDKA